MNPPDARRSRVEGSEGSGWALNIRLLIPAGLLTLRERTAPDGWGGRGPSATLSPRRLSSEPLTSRLVPRTPEAGGGSRGSGLTTSTTAMTTGPGRRSRLLSVIEQIPGVPGIVETQLAFEERRPTNKTGGGPVCSLGTAAVVSREGENRDQA